MKYFTKESGIDWKHMGKEYILPGLVAGPVMGLGISAFTSKDKKDFKENAGKAVVAGVAGDIATSAAMGLWNQRKNILKSAALQKATKAGDKVRNTHRRCKYFGAEGIAINDNEGDKTSFIVTNTGENYKPGDKLRKKNKWLYRLGQ